MKARAILKKIRMSIAETGIYGHLRNLRISITGRDILRLLGKLKPNWSSTGYAFLMLTIISMALDAAVVLIGLSAIATNNHKFCQIIDTAVPVSKPANPVADPSREKNYEEYVKVHDLGKSLGCY